MLAVVRDFSRGSMTLSRHKNILSGTDHDLARAILASLNGMQAVICFDPDGTVADANENFLETLGYRREEVVGQHHRLFVTPSYAASAEYRRFWEDLRAGKSFDGDFCRRAKNGAEVWIAASYSPLRDKAGTLCGIVKFATEVTETKKTVLGLCAGLKAQNAGDLTVRLPVPAKGDLVQVVRDFNASMTSLGDLVGDLSASGEEIALSARDLSGGAGRLSRMAQTQASAIEQAAASLDELKRSVASNLSLADDSRQQSLRAAQAATEGSEVARGAVELITQLEKTSRAMSAATETISGIAFQTNMLALNAGIEAARAGDSGRGFAVIANEIRSLAQKASQSSQDISGLIDRSNDLVRLCADVVRDSHERMAEMERISTGVARGISEVAEASAAQARAIEDVSTAANEISSQTSTSAQLAEDTAESVHVLERLSERLRGLVSRFRTQGAPRPHLRRSA
jgi:methyl-accepting chemotaxis protein